MDPTLYDHLGGRDTIELAVRGLYARLLEDPEIGPVFDGVDVLRLRSHMTSFLSAALGSGLVQMGRNLQEVHAGLQITDEMFDATVAHLVDMLASLEVAEELIARVTTTIAPLRTQVVHGSALV
jgi:hemoglobin